MVYDARDIYSDIQPVVPPSPFNVIGQTGSIDPNSYELDFSQLQSSFSLTRPLIRAGTTGIVLPEWQVSAFDSSGSLLSTVGESLTGTYVDRPARTFTLNGPGIHSVVIASNSYRFAAFRAMVFDDFTIDSRPDLAATSGEGRTA